MGCSSAHLLNTEAQEHHHRKGCEHDDPFQRASKQSGTQLGVANNLAIDNAESHGIGNISQHTGQAQGNSHIIVDLEHIAAQALIDLSHLGGTAA